MAGAVGSTRGVVVRKDGRTLKRVALYLEVDLARALMMHCAMADRDASAVVSEAVAEHLARVARPGGRGAGGHG